MVHLESRGQEVDFSLAIEAFQSAQKLLADENPDKLVILNNLGQALLSRANPEDLAAALEAFQTGIKLVLNRQGVDVKVKENLIKGIIALMRKSGDNVLPSVQL